MSSSDNNLCKEGLNEAIISENYLDLIVEYRGNISKVLQIYNAQYFQIIDEIFAVIYIPISQKEAAFFNPKFPVIGIPKLLGPYGKDDLDSSGILFFHEHPFVPLRGFGTIIGFVDSGIDYTHPVFKYEDNTTKILNIWDQTIEGNPPEGFCYGTEYTQEDINGALKLGNPYNQVPQRDDSGHGTFLAGVAAGRENKENEFIGAAPDAEIIMVKLKQAKQYLKDELFIPDNVIAYQENDIMLGIKYILNLALSYNKPVCIVIGVGSNQHTHIGEANIERYLSSISLRYNGLVTIIAAGNEGNTSHHYRGQLSTNKAYDDVEINVAKNENGFYTFIMGSIPDVLSLVIIAPNGHVLERIEPSLLIVKEYSLPLENTKVKIRYEVTSLRHGVNFMYVSIAEPIEGIWTYRVYGEIIVNGRFDIWLPRLDWVKKETKFLNPNPFTTVTLPSNPPTPITVGAYNHVNDALYISTGRGLTAAGNLKPDLVAPGVKVFGPLPNNRFGTMTGTSIAAAITGGASALLLEWGIVLGKDPTMNTRIVKNWLIRGATRKDNIIYPNREWGYGQLNLLSAFERLRGIK